MSWFFGGDKESKTQTTSNSAPSGEMFSGMNMNQPSNMSEEEMLALALKRSRTEALGKKDTVVNSNELPNSSSGFSFVSSDEPSDIPIETNSGFSFIGSDPTPPATSSSFGFVENSGFSFITENEDTGASAATPTFSEAPINPSISQTTKTPPATSQPQEDFFAALIQERNLDKEDSVQKEETENVDEPVVAPAGDMFGGLQMTNTGDMDMFSGMSMDVEPEPVESVSEPEVLEHSGKDEEMERDPVVVVKREPSTKAPTPRLKTYENNLEGQLEMHKDSCNKQCQKLWVQIQKTQEYQLQMKEREESLLKQLEDKKKECQDLEHAQSQAIQDEDYDLADEKNRQAANAKSAMARFERRIRDIRKDLKKNIAKKHESFSMLRIVHHDTTIGVQETSDKFSAEQFDHFKNESREIDDNLSRLQAKFDRAERILQNTDEELEGINAKEAAILETIKDQNKDVVAKKEELENDRDQLHNDIESLKEQIRLKEIAVCEVEQEILDLTQTIEDAKGEYKEELGEIEGSRNRILLEREEHENDQSEINEQIAKEKSRKEENFVAEEDFRQVLREADAYRERVTAIAKLIRDMEVKHAEVEESQTSIIEKITLLSEEVQTLAADEATNKLESMQEELEAKRNHLSFIENKIPALQAQKQKHVSAKRFRDAGAVHKEIKSLTQQKEEAEKELSDLQQQERELREACSGRMDKLEQLKEQLEDANVNKDQQQFDELIYMMKWVESFLSFVSEDPAANEILRADLAQFQRDWEVLHSRHGWTIPEETSETEQIVEVGDAEEDKEVAPAEPEQTQSVEDLQILLAEKECIFEELNQSMESAIATEDYETAATIQDEVDVIKEEIDALVARIAELGVGIEEAAAEKASVSEDLIEEPVAQETEQILEPEEATESIEPEQIQPDKALADPPDNTEAEESFAAVVEPSEPTEDEPVLDEVAGSEAAEAETIEEAVDSNEI